MTERGTLDSVFEYFSGTVEWIADIFRDPENFAALMRHLGWKLEPDGFDLGSFMNKFSGLSPLITDIQSIATLAAELKDAEGDRKLQIYGEMASITPSILAAVNELSNVTFVVGDLPPPLNTQEFYDYIPEFPRRLLDFCIATQLEYTHPRIYAALVLFGIIKVDEVVFNPPSPGRVDYINREVNWQALGDFLSTPAQVLNQLYNWNIPGKNLDIAKLIKHLERLISAYNIPVGRYRPPPQYLQKYFHDTAISDVPQGLRIRFYDGTDPDVGAYVSLGFYIIPIPSNNPDTPSAGFLLVPYAIGKSAMEFPLNDQFLLTLSGNLSTDTGAGIEFRPGSVAFDVDDPADLIDTKGALVLTTARTEPFIVFGTSKGTRFEIGKFSISTEATAAGGETPELMTILNFEDASIVIHAGDGDGFIQKILPKNPVQINFDLTVGMSTCKGFYVKGGAGFEYTFQVNKSLGPIFINAIDLKLDAQRERITLITAASGTAVIGPVTATVQKIGLKTILEFGKPGILGNADISIAPKMPDGMGMAVEVPPVVKGGGYLSISEGNYAGILQLDIQNTVSITAICILTTRMPDGSKIFSLKILGFVEFPPIQLGMGFILTGIGMAAAIECRMNEDALRAAVYEGRLTSLLFPPDPIKNAQQIISDLQSFFPPQPNYHVFGIMAKFGWGGATSLIKADLGIFIEIGGPLRIVLAGRGHAELPSEDSALIQLNFQILGILDFGNKSLFIDASLEGSKLLFLSLDGDLILRLIAADKPRFATSIGGFYPGYSLPAVLRIPVPMDRLSVSLSSGNPRVGVFLYMAITENSVQFGAALLLHWQKDLGSIDLGICEIDLGLIEVDGGFMFDALFKFNPFYFETKMCAWLTLKRNGDVLMGIDVRLFLSGPNNYHAKGSASLNLLGIKLKAGFDVTFGDKKPEIPQTILSPLDVLKAELDNPKNWGVALPPWGEARVIFREGSDAEELLDSDGYSLVRQKAVPYQSWLEKLGQAGIPPGEDYFDLLPGEHMTAEPTMDFFASGEYKYLSVQEQVSGPPYELRKSGLMSSSKHIQIPRRPEGNLFREDITIIYETKYPGESEYRPKEVMPNVLMDSQKLGGQRVYNKSNVKPPSAKLNRIRIAEQSFTLVTPEAKQDKFERATYKKDGVTKKVENLTYSQARERKKRFGITQAEILDTIKAADL